MSPRANAVRRTEEAETQASASVSPIFNVMRDFSQPWMDLNDKSVLVTGGTSAILDTLAIRFAREGRTVLTEELTYDFGRLIFTGRGVETTRNSISIASR